DGADTLAMEPAASVATRVKSSVEILLTDSSKVTAKSMLAALAAGAPLGAMLVTLGAAASTKTEVVTPTLLRVRLASLETESRKVPPFVLKVPTEIPSVSDSPA